MASYVRNVHTKNYKKSRYPSPSSYQLFILMLISRVLISPGSAEAYVV